MAMLILFLAVLVGGALSHGSDAMGAQETPPAVDPGYRLGAEDVMLISVWKDEQLTREVVVRPDGMFSFPLVGDVQAEDRTVEEIRADACETADEIHSESECVGGSHESA